MIITRSRITANIYMYIGSFFMVLEMVSVTEPTISEVLSDAEPIKDSSVAAALVFGVINVRIASAEMDSFPTGY